MTYRTETADEAIRLFAAEMLAGQPWHWINRTLGTWMMTGGRFLYRVQFTKEGWEIS